MLLRAFRLTDKLGNALLRLQGWLIDWLLGQMQRLRLGLITSTLSLFTVLTSTVRTGRAAVQTVSQSTEERRRVSMARRSADEEARPAVREDPLKTQNRALSLFTVVLLGSLILLVLWFTGTQQIGFGAPPRGNLPPLQPSVTRAVAIAPTIRPTETINPDPLRVGGSIVYTLRDHGFENLWVVELGQPQPFRLTNGRFDDTDPVWSHDGKRIAFASHRDGNWDLYEMEVATGRITRLTYTAGYERNPTWSPDDAYIAYEAYENSKLDIWIVGATGKPEPQRLTENPAPNFAPDWSPSGREIAYVSLREGRPNIFVINLDRLGNPKDSTAVRLTNTNDVEEDEPVWSPDGKRIAYWGRDSSGLDLIYAKTVGDPAAESVAIGPGRDPAWAPDGASVIRAVDGSQGTTLISYQVNNIGFAATTLSLKQRARHPNWTRAALPSSLTQNPPPIDSIAPELYKEDIGFQQDKPPYRQLRNLSKLLTDVKLPFMSDSVDASFLALREAARERIGLDFLGARLDILWPISGPDRYIPDPGQPLQNWHYAGRAIDFDRNLVYSSNPDDPPPVEVVREDDPNGNTAWRVYVRVPSSLQTGALGEPLKRYPWDFASRASQDPQAYENGGRPKPFVPPGYYVDFTTLAEDYGWLRVPANRAWRALASGILYWEFDKRENLSWNDAMLELYTQDEINAFLQRATAAPHTVADGNKRRTDPHTHTSSP